MFLLNQVAESFDKQWHDIKAAKKGTINNYVFR